MISKSILALSALAGAAYAATGETVTTSLAVTTINDNDGIGAGSNTYKFYSGTGTVADGWPALDDWFVLIFSTICKTSSRSILIYNSLGSRSATCSRPTRHT